MEHRGVCAACGEPWPCDVGLQQQRVREDEWRRLAIYAAIDGGTATLIRRAGEPTMISAGDTVSPFLRFELPLTDEGARAVMEQAGWHFEDDRIWR